MFIHCFGPTPKSNSQITSSACSFIVLGPPPSPLLRSQVPHVDSLFWAHLKSNSQITSSACSFIVLGSPPSQILRSQVPRVHSLFWAHPQVKFSDHKFRVFIHFFGPTPKSNSQITSSACSFIVLGPPPSQILRSQVPRVHSLFWAHPQVKFSDHKFRVFIHCLGPTPKSNSQITSSVCSFIVLGPPPSQILR